MLHHQAAKRQPVSSIPSVAAAAAAAVILNADRLLDVSPSSTINTQSIGAQTPGRNRHRQQ